MTVVATDRATLAAGRLLELTVTDLALIELTREGARREWTFGEIATRSASLELSRRNM